MLCGQLDILCCSIKNLEYVSLIERSTTIHELQDALYDVQLSADKLIETFRYSNEILDDLTLASTEMSNK